MVDKHIVDLRGQEDDWHAHMHRKRAATDVPQEIVFDAIEFAAVRHRGQLRKGTSIPYMTHLMNVCALLASHDCDPEVVAGGVLHDSVEDTDTTLEEIGGRFGSRVAAIVRGATEPAKLDKLNPPSETGTWRERKEHTIHFIVAEATPDVVLVSCADKLDNIRAIAADFERHGDLLWERFNAPKSEQKWYYQELAAAFLKLANKGDGGAALAAFSAELQALVRRVFA